MKLVSFLKDLGHRLVPEATDTSPEAARSVDAKSAVVLNSQGEPLEAFSHQGPSGELVGSKSSAAAKKSVADVRKKMKGWISDRDEASVLDALRQADSVTINQILADANIGRFFSTSWIGEGFDNRGELFKVLTQERIGDISIANRAALISAAQKFHTDGSEERLIADLFMGTQGRELSELKLLVDKGGDHRDLSALVYRDIDDTSVREQILQHFAKEAKEIGRIGIKYYSDLDDTIYANFADTRYPKKAVYPGSGAFAAAFDGPTTIITVRPSDRPGILEDYWTFPGLAKRGIKDVVVAGVDIDSDVDPLYLLDHDKMAAAKKLNFDRYQALYPEYGMVFGGDNSQGDQAAGEMMLAAKSELGQAVFIHDLAKDGKKVPQEERQTLAAKGVFIFDNYVEAAQIAFEHGMITQEALMQVVEESANDMKNLYGQFKEPKDQALLDVQNEGLTASIARAKAAVSV